MKTQNVRNQESNSKILINITQDGKYKVPSPASNFVTDMT